MSPRSIAAICRITAARLVRRISGSVKRGRSSKSSSLRQPDRDAVGDAAAAALALVGARPGEIGSIGSRWTFSRAL